ncbi:hypothetical protein EBR66_07530 [bacterium]|nr:hypothetical protein [bacterium]
MTSVCNSTTLANIASSTAFQAWKDASDITLNSISPTSASGATPPTDLETTTLVQVSNQIFDTQLCINEKMGKLYSTTDSIQKAQEDIIRLTKEIAKAEEHTEIAKNRVEYIRNPDDHTSYYESWFPIHRPMYKESVPIFIAIIVFMGVIPIVFLVAYMMSSPAPGAPPGIFTRIYNAIMNKSPPTNRLIPNPPATPPNVFSRLSTALHGTHRPPIPAPKSAPWLD